MKNWKCARYWLGICLVFLGIQGVGTVYGLFRSDIVNQDMLTVGTVKIDLVELQDQDHGEQTARELIQGNLVKGEWMDLDESEEETARRKENLGYEPGDVWIHPLVVKNRGNRPVYVRVRLPEELRGFELVQATDDWLMEESGTWYYYCNPLQPGEESSCLTEGVYLPLLMDNRYAGRGWAGDEIRLQFHAEAVQQTAAKEAMKYEWNREATLREDGKLIRVEAQ